MSNVLTGGYDGFETQHECAGSAAENVHPQVRDDVVAAIALAAALSGHCLALSSALPRDQASTFQGLGV